MFGFDFILWINDPSIIFKLLYQKSMIFIIIFAGLFIITNTIEEVKNIITNDKEKKSVLNIIIKFIYFFFFYSLQVYAVMLIIIFIFQFEFMYNYLDYIYIIMFFAILFSNQIFKVLLFKIIKQYIYSQLTNLDKTLNKQKNQVLFTELLDKEYIKKDE